MMRPANMGPVTRGAYFLFWGLIISAILALVLGFLVSYLRSSKAMVVLEDGTGVHMSITPLTGFGPLWDRTFYTEHDGRRVVNETVISSDTWRNSNLYRSPSGVLYLLDGGLCRFLPSNSLPNPPELRLQCEPVPEGIVPEPSHSKFFAELVYLGAFYVDWDAGSTLHYANADEREERRSLD